MVEKTRRSQTERPGFEYRNSRRSGYLWRVGVVLCAAGLLLSSCLGNNTPPAEESTAPSTVVISFPWDMAGINELIVPSTALSSTLYYFALYLQLLEEQPDFANGPAEFKPRFAQSYEFSEDRLNLTFHLRDGMQWSDGAPMTAEDVRFTWQAQTHPDVGWDLAYSKKRIHNVEVIDPLTVRFHFTQAYATQMLDANNGVILPKHAWGQLPFEQWATNLNWFQQRIVVSGAYILTTWEPGQRIVLDRNPHYFEPDLPKIDRVIFQITPDQDSQMAMVRAGQAHIVEAIHPNQAQGVIDNQDLELLSYDFRQFVFLCWNTRLELFADAEVRRALTLGIDRQRIVDSVYRGYAKVAYSPYPSFSWVHNRDLQPLPYNPAEARRILAAKGWVDSDGDGIVERDGKPFSFSILTGTGNQIRIDMLVLIQENLRRIGIDAQPRVVEVNSQIELQNKGEFEAVISGLGIDTSFDVSYLFQTGGLFNWAGYSDAEADRIQDEIASTIEPITAKPLYDRLQELLQRDQPLTFLYEPQRLVVVRRDLQQVDPNSVSTYYNLRSWQLADDR